MAYRTYVGTTGKDEIQILGNNEYYQPFIDELKRQGIKVDESGWYGIEFEDNESKSVNISIKDIQPFIDILENYIWERDIEAKLYCDEDIFNLRPTEKTIIKDFTFRMRELQEDSYIFVTANLVNYLKENLDVEYDIERQKYIYKIKDGKKVWFSAC